MSWPGLRPGLAWPGRARWPFQTPACQPAGLVREFLSWPQGPYLASHSRCMDGRNKTRVKHSKAFARLDLEPFRQRPVPPERASCRRHRMLGGAPGFCTNYQWIHEPSWGLWRWNPVSLKPHSSEAVEARERCIRSGVLRPVPTAMPCWRSVEDKVPIPWDAGSCWCALHTAGSSRIHPSQGWSSRRGGVGKRAWTMPWSYLNLLAQTPHPPCFGAVRCTASAPPDQPWRVVRRPPFPGRGTGPHPHCAQHTPSHLTPVTDQTPARACIPYLLAWGPSAGRQVM